MIDEFFDLSRRFIANYNREYTRYFVKKNTLENRFSIIIGPKGIGKTTAIIQYLLKFAGNRGIGDRRPLSLRFTSDWELDFLNISFHKALFHP
jgi:predicted AAA+ superfamily ATPase